MNQITAKELENKIKAGEKINVIDVRTAEQAANGKIAEAKNIPLEEITNCLAELNQNEHYYLICTRGVRSSHAAEQLSGMGYQTTNVRDGMLAWEGTVE